MSNYRIYTPVDISSNTATAPGQINIYNGATNYTALKSPTVLAADTPFILDNAAGVVGDYITTDGTGVTSFTPGLTSILPINMNISGSTAITPSSSVSSTFVTVGSIYWRGTPIEGDPSAVRVILSGNATGGEVMLIEVVTGVIVALRTGITVTATPTIYDIPILTAFSPINRTMYIQTRRTIAGTINIWSIQIKP